MTLPLRSRPPFPKRLLASSLAVTAIAAVLASTNEARAASVIRRPGLHPMYNVEVEPHLQLQWAQTPWSDEGFGPGVRINIPFLDNGPIPKINNNMAIGFGFDWSIFDDQYGWCYGRNAPGPAYDYDCDASAFWFPVVLQWNFFLTDIISVFGEPGFAIAHYRWDSDYCSGGEYYCGGSDTDLRFVFWAGGRFQFGESIGLVVRLGTPYISVGANFLF